MGKCSIPLSIGDIHLKVSENDSVALISEQASLLLASSRDILKMIASENDRHIGGEIWGAITLLELAKGLVDNLNGEVSHG